jgi:hypothetical protein
MIVFAIYHIDYGFIGLYASPESSKSFSREFVDCVICNGEEGSCDLIANNAGKTGGFSWYLSNIMNLFGWERKSQFDDYDQTFSCYAFSAVWRKAHG